MLKEGPRPRHRPSCRPTARRHGRSSSCWRRTRRPASAREKSRQTARPCRAHAAARPWRRRRRSARRRTAAARRRLHEIGAVRQGRALRARSRAAAMTGALDVEAGRHGAAPCFSTRCSAMPPEPQPMSSTRLPVSDRPATTRSTSSGPAGRQIAIAPQRLQEADRRVVIFGRIVGVCAHRMRSLPSRSPDCKA